jgi:alpha-L-arabinofuranosidase
MFRVANDDDRRWWNIGGWNNTQDAIEVDSAIDGKPGHVEVDRWYDIKLTVEGKRVKCWLDGQLVHDIDYISNDQYSFIYATSAVDKKTGDIIIKVVNTAAEPVDTELNLVKANLTGKGTATVLTSEKPEDENSLAEPTRVSPKSEAISFTGTKLKRAFPGNSFTVLKLQTSK